MLVLIMVQKQYILSYILTVVGGGVVGGAVVGDDVVGEVWIDMERCDYNQSMLYVVNNSTRKRTIYLPLQAWMQQERMSKEQTVDEYSNRSSS